MPTPDKTSRKRSALIEIFVYCIILMWVIGSVTLYFHFQEVETNINFVSKQLEEIEKMIDVRGKQILGEKDEE